MNIKNIWDSTHAARVITNNRIMGVLAIGAFALFAMTSAFASPAADPLQQAANSAKAEIATAEAAATTKKADLAKKYLLALANLEKTLASSGALDDILHLREEKESIEKSGSTTAHTDKALVEVRDKYLKGLATIDDEIKAVRVKATATFTKKAQEQETFLTKSLKVEQALAVRKQAAQLAAELNGGAPAVPGAAENQSIFDLAETPSIKPLKPIKLPEKTPAIVQQPFSLKGTWLIDMTVPAMKQKLKNTLMIGDRGKQAWPLVVLSPGSAWTGGDSANLDLSAGKLLATKSSFDKLRLLADLSSEFYFKNCFFDDCRFGKGGVWYGSDMAAKFYLEGCVIKGKFAHPLNIVDNGLRIENCVFDDVELPTFKFRKKQPADYINASWLRVANTRFVKCKVPMSFLLLTRDCVFENCILMDDKEKPSSEEEITKPLEITVYLKTSVMKINNIPAKVTLTQKGESELKGVTVPTISTLTPLLAP